MLVEIFAFSIENVLQYFLGRLLRYEVGNKLRLDQKPPFSKIFKNKNKDTTSHLHN